MAFICPFCEASFQYEDRLKVHIIQKHLNLPTNEVKDSDNKEKEAESIKQKVKEDVKEKVSKNEESEDIKDEVLEIKPPPTLKPKKFKITRKSMEDTILITWEGEFYFKFILLNATSEMKNEISEGIANWIYNYLKNNKDVQFRVVKRD